MRPFFPVSDDTGQVPLGDGQPLQQEVFGPYIVHERLGVGGMATVHRAKEHGIEGFARIVALKRLLPHLAEDASFVKSFVREAKLASMLRHANIVQLYELGRVNTTYFISMEYIDGRDIRRILRQGRKVTGPPTVNVTLSLLIQLSDALDYAHTRIDDESGEPLKLVHRDVSPSNLLVTKSGHLKVIDFGIAKAQSSQLRTATGRVKGKLAYMAPEAIAGKELDARSDIFSAGVIAHELLTARPLFASKNEYQTLLKVQKGDITPPSAFNQACPPELDAIVLKALARDRDQRFQSAAEMRDALHEVRIRYQVSATNREVASWCDWAFSMEGPGNNFSGPMVTDSLSGMSQSRSPIQMPLQAPTSAGSSGSMAAQSMTMQGVPQAHHHDEDGDADVAWGGAQDPDSHQPVVLDEVPDHSHRSPSAAGALAAAAADAPRRTLVGAAVAAPRHITPAKFPVGSSDDALAPPSRFSGGRPRTGQVQIGAAVDAPYAPHARDTEPTPLVEASSFGAGIVGNRGAPSSNTGRNVAIGVAVLAIAGLAIFFLVNRGKSDATTADRGSAAGTGAPDVAPIAKLKFIVDPKDSTVRIAGLDPHSGSDWVVELEAGVQQVEISHEGYKSWVTSIELSANEFQTIRVVLEKGGNPAVATLVLDSDPSGVTVLLDGKEIGRTPIHEEITPGQHTVALRENGVIKWKEQFNASGNSVAEFHPSLTDLQKQKEREERERIAASGGGGPSRPQIVPEKRAPTTSGGGNVGSTSPPVAIGSGSAKVVTPPATGSGSASGSATVTTPVTGSGSGSASGSAKVTTTGSGSASGSAKGSAKVATGSGSASGSATPKPAVKPVTITPNQVKRTSGDIGQIKTTVRQNESLPSTLAVKICIDAAGKVSSAKVMSKVSSDLAGKVESAVKGFKYSPYKDGGVATPACFAETFKLK